ncbi:MAG: hypothetical protein LC136_07750 [Burkholderiales bacterium]|nr:hypothetical protein [Burkholderiales bacterium]
MTKTKRIEYVEVPADTVPSGLRWDVPGANQGQMVEVAYADPGSRAPAEHGDPWQRVTDRSERPGSPRRVRYYRLRPALEWRTERSQAHIAATGTVETRRREVPETRYALLADMPAGPDGRPRRRVLGPISDSPLRKAGAMRSVIGASTNNGKVTADCLPGEVVVPVRDMIGVWTREETADAVSARVERYEVEG